MEVSGCVLALEVGLSGMLGVVQDLLTELHDLSCWISKVRDHVRVGRGLHDQFSPLDLLRQLVPHFSGQLVVACIVLTSFEFKELERVFI